MAREAFNLTKENPISDVIEGKDGFYVMKLTKIEASRPLTLEEAKDQIIAAIKEEKAQAAIQAKAKEVREKIDAEMQKGSVSFKRPRTRATKLKLRSRLLSSDPGNNVELARFIAMNGVELNTNETSKLLQDQGSALIIHMIKKEADRRAKIRRVQKSRIRPAK